MKTECAYILFEKLLDEEKIYFDPTLSFEEICLLTGISPEPLNNLLIEEHGFCGDEILAIYRNAEYRRIDRIISALYTTEPCTS